MEELKVKVTKIKDRWHARLYFQDKVYDEMACDRSEDISLICRTMMRWFDKASMHYSKYASKARDRTTEKCRSFVGKIWYKNSLDEERSVHNK
jgi:hypothetical protein